MLPTFLISEAMQWVQNELTLTWFLVMHPIIPAKDVWMYWASIAATIGSLLIIEATKKLTVPNDVYWMDTFYHPPEKTMNDLSHPLPEDWMVLNTVRLKMGFVGWLRKLGKQFTGMMSSLHQIGDNSVWLMSIATRHYSSKLKGRASRPLPQTLGAIANQVIGTGSQLGSSMLLITGIADSVLKTTSFYLIALLFLRLASLQPVQARCTSRVVEPQQTHPIINTEIGTVNWKVNTRDLATQDMDLLALDNENKVLYSPRPLCLSTQSEISLVNNKCMALANLSPSQNEDTEINFANEHTEFGTDNCATHHICSDYNLFKESTYKLIESVGVQGIAGRAVAKGIGTVVFTVMDDNGEKSTITLKNVIHLPEASKNLISISQWSRDNKDNCGVMSRGSHSIFMWDNDHKTKHIPHNPSCSIPLMPVNENEDKYSNYLRKHTDMFADNLCLLGEGVCVGEDSTGDTEMNKQFMDVDSQMITSTPVPVGTIVKVNFKGNGKICIVTKKYLKGNGTQGYQVRPLNDSLHSIVNEDDIHLIKPDPADIPHSPTDLDPEVVHKCLTKEDLHKLWNCSIDDTVSKEHRVTLYWHHRLRHLTLIGLKKLAKRGLIPKCILKVKKMPLCAACAFAKAHRRNWRSKGSKRKGEIRSRKSKQPGDGTSCDHIVSQQPGLTPQSHGKLTHAR